MPLSDAACRNATSGGKPVKISDGRGLYLLVQPTGAKLWRLAYRFGGKQKTLALGTYPVVSLSEARKRREMAKDQLASGIDPSHAKKEAKKAARMEAAGSFESVAREWFAARKASWSSAYADRLMRRLEADVFTAVGSKPVGCIEPPELLGAVRAVEARGAIELAKRLLQVTGQVFRFAVATGRAKRDPTQDLRGALQSAGPQKHRAALKANELAAFLAALEAYDGDRRTALGVKLVLHTFVRSAEARFATWSEFEDLDGPAPVWRIPAERMKARSEHLVPLSPQVVRIILELKSVVGGGERVFPSSTKKGVISENTWLYALYRLGYHSRVTVHGFRRTASTILNEQGFNRDWIERQLAHKERNDVRAAYNAAEWLADRRAMMRWWSSYLEGRKLGAGVSVWTREQVEAVIDGPHGSIRPAGSSPLITPTLPNRQPAGD
jgi:integrase